MWNFCANLSRIPNSNRADFRLIFVFSLAKNFSQQFFRRRKSYSLLHFRVITFSCRGKLLSSIQGAKPMEWTTPQHEEIDLNCEVSSYANAEL